MFGCHGVCEGLREQDIALCRSAHCRDTSDLVDGRSDHSEVETLVTADIAVEHFTDVKADIDIRDRQVVLGAALVEPGKLLLQEVMCGN